MTLLDHFRRRPPWEDPSPEVRAEAVRHMSSEEQDLLARLAQSDTDARVRRAAVRKLVTPAALAGCQSDSDTDVRDAAAEALLRLAQGEDVARAEAALAAIADARSLATLSRSAALAAVRSGALARLTEPRGLAAVAKTATDAAIRLAALARVDDPSLLADVAGKSEHKDAALAAVERLDDPDALAHVAARARNRAAARRAAARKEALAPVAPPAAETRAEAAEASPPALPAPTPEATAEEPVVEEPAAETLAAEEPAAEEPAAEEPAAEEPALEAAAGGAPMAATPEGTSGPPEEQQAPPATTETAQATKGEAEEQRRKREQERKETLARIDVLCNRLEALRQAEAPGLRGAEAALREARAAQDHLGTLPPKLRQRFKAARSALFARTQELREADEWTRWANAAVQEELCKRTEALVAVEDLERVARELRDCDARWAEARYAPRDEAEALRQRYQTARAQLKSRLDVYFAGKSAEEGASLKRKEALCERAAALADSTDWLKAADELKALQAEWKQIGPAPRRHAEAIWRRFRAACDRFFTRREADLRQRKQEWAANLAKKDALCVRAEGLAGSTDWEAAAAEIRRLQGEWKTIGPVQRKRSEDVWQRFRKACDAFFERYKRRDEVELERKRAEREALCLELEALVPPSGGEPSEGERPPAPADLAQRVQALQAKARPGALPAEQEEALSRRFDLARTRLVTAYPESFRGTDLDPEANRTKRERLCKKVEALVAAGGAAGGEPLSGEALARRLKEALASNTIGGAAEAEARRRAEVEDVRAAQAAWRKVGPLPGEEGAALERRFRSACDRFFAQREPARSTRTASVR